MKANRIFSKDEEAVSPVIGVILMVAITVILAAVIAAFVFGMGGNLSTAPPTVSITATNNAADGTLDLKINHNGGELLKGTEWKVSVVAQGDAPLYIYSEADDDFQVGGQIVWAGTVAAEKTHAFANATDAWTYCSHSDQDFDQGDKYDVKMVHIPSNSLILDTIVEVR